ncbi:MAG: serine hydrolase [bacterium]
MSKNLKMFLVSFLLALPFWWGTNFLERELKDSFFGQLAEENPQVATAQINEIVENIEKTEEVSQPKIEPLTIEADAVLSVRFDAQGNKKILLGNNEKEKLPIASLTKLMTAVVAEDIYPEGQIIKVSKEAVQQPGVGGLLKPDELLPVEELLKMAIIESSNDAAYALSQGQTIDEENTFNQKSFIELMNLKADEWNLQDTEFFNPTGLDGGQDKENYSTASDLADLAYRLIIDYPKIFEISQQKSCQTTDSDGNLHHLVESTNRLIDVIPNLAGGKTGYTEGAGGCILTVLKEDDAYIVNVILGSADQETRFSEMEKLINWIK